MDTFSSDSITNQTGITNPNVKGIPRNVKLPVKLPTKFTSEHKKSIKELSKSILKITELLGKLS